MYTNPWAKHRAKALYMLHNLAMNSAYTNAIEYEQLGTQTDIELAHDAYTLNTTVQTTELILNDTH